MTKRLRVHLLDKNAKVPEYAHPDDSGMDVFSIEETRVPSLIDGIVCIGYDGDIDTVKYALDCIELPYVKVKTGISLEVPEGYEIQVRPKSGLAIKNGIGILNSPGTIDEGYRGELQIILFNLSKEDYWIKPGQKIAQIVLCPVEKAEVIVMDDTQRGSGGFGSTGLCYETRPLQPILDRQNAKTMEAIDSLSKQELTYEDLRKAYEKAPPVDIKTIKVRSGSEATASYTIEDGLD